MNYAIAYADRNGRDFNGMPWIEDGFDNYEDAERMRQQWVVKGNIQKSFVFRFTGSHPDEITWEYAEAHKVMK